MGAESIRKIIHVDMDAFYASVEQKDQPHLRGKPVLVGGKPGGRGVVAAASYEARAFGVHSAMPASKALRLCPEAVFVRPNFERYKEVSSQIQAIFHSFTDLVEPLSLDEAFLDVTHLNTSATWVANTIRAQIFKETGLTASAGVAPGKFLAKIASDVNKPNGIFVVPPSEVLSFIEQLPIRRFFGIGKATEERMLLHGIKSGKELREKSLTFLVQYFGKPGHFYYQISRGIDNREVRPTRTRKSISVERTFPEDIYSRDDLNQMLVVICQDLAERMEKKGLLGRTIHLKVRFENFETCTRSYTRSVASRKAEDLYETSKVMLKELLSENEFKNRGIRLLGVGCSHLEDKSDPLQLTLPF